jgi:hypothetical protein
MSRLHLPDLTRPRRTLCGLHVAGVRLGGLQMDLCEASGSYRFTVFAEPSGDPCADCLCGQLGLFSDERSAPDSASSVRAGGWS